MYINSHSIQIYVYIYIKTIYITNNIYIQTIYIYINNIYINKIYCTYKSTSFFPLSFLPALYLVREQAMRSPWRGLGGSQLRRFAFFPKALRLISLDLKVLVWSR